MPTPRISVRPMEATDVEAVAELSSELGYPATAQQLLARFGHVRRSSSEQPSEILVAQEIDAGTVVGWVHVCVPVALVMEDVAEIWGLVVAFTHRGCGVGRALMTAAEDWAVEQGCSEMRLRSGSHRAGAHAFYQHLGYQITKTQLTLSRTLVDDARHFSP